MREIGIEQPLRLKDAARRVGRCPDTLRRYGKMGLIDIIQIGGALYVPMREVRRLCGTPEPTPFLDWKARQARNDV